MGAYRDFVEIWRESVAARVLLVFVAGFLALLVYGVVYEAEHPCLRYETRHSDWTIIGYDHKMRPIWGPGDEKTCVERAP